jgi:hypothetical protein
MKTTIYRTGQMRVQTHEDEALQHWAEFDIRRPAGHVSRSEALFASPNLQGAHCWLFDGVILSSRGHSKKAIFNEITVESDTVLVYSIKAYHMVKEHYGKPSGEEITAIEAYWSTSMTLTEWMREVGEDSRGQWEVMIPESEVISSRTITYTELRGMYEEEGLDDETLNILDKYLRASLEAAEITV